MNLDLGDYARPDPSDVPAFARHWFRIRVGACLEHYAHDVENGISDGPDWDSEIVQEAEEYHSRGPSGYLAFVAESYERGRRARLQADFQNVIDGISLSGTDRPNQ